MSMMRLGAASSMPDHPNIWTDGSRVLDRVTGGSSSGAGFFARHPEECWGSCRWGHVARVRPEGEIPSFQGFLLLPWAFAVCSES